MKKLSSQSNISILVIDIGGTSFRSALFFKNKIVGKPIKEITPNFINNPKVGITKLQRLLINKIVKTVKRYQKISQNIKVVGISFPAPITSTGIVTQACTVWGNKGKNFHIEKQLKKFMPNIDFVITNDITAAAERYSTINKFNKLDYFAIITVSSGIGGKIYDNKNKTVLLDKRSIGGEMGHVKIDFSPDAPLCDCGGRGHLGAISSGRAIEKLAITQAKKFYKEYSNSILYKYSPDPTRITNNNLVKAIKKHDKFSLHILDKTTFHLANSISHISGNIGADRYIIIGGFALNCGSEYINSLRRSLKKVDFYGRHSSEIKKLVELGIKDDNSCLIGIGLLSEKKLAKKYV